VFASPGRHSRSRRAATCALLFGVAAVFGAGCGHGSGRASPTTLVPATTVPETTVTTPPATAAPTTRAPAPTTTVVVPSAPQASAEAAASQLVDAWSTGDRARARTVATQAAVASLFAAPFPGAGLAIPRGCSDDFQILCIYGPPGGGNPADNLYELTASQSAKGWFISSVTILP
jgi:hypothetical protein